MEKAAYRHVLAQIDVEARTAVCLRCGPVKIVHLGTGRKGQQRWRCQLGGQEAYRRKMDRKAGLEVPPLPLRLRKPKLDVTHWRWCSNCKVCFQYRDKRRVFCYGCLPLGIPQAEYRRRYKQLTGRNYGAEWRAKYPERYQASRARKRKGFIECRRCGVKVVLQSSGSASYGGTRYCDICRPIVREKWLKKCRETNADHARKRRFLKNTSSERIRLSEVGERDGWICHICLEPIDPTLRAKRVQKGLWWGPSIDHIVPLKRGGSHTMGNVAIAHHRCNSLRGAGDDEMDAFEIF